MRAPRFAILALLALAAVWFGVACGDDKTPTTAPTTAPTSSATTSPTATATQPATATPTRSASETSTAAETSTSEPLPEGTLRLGYFANITHAQAIVGLQNGLFADALGPNVKIEPVVFNAGPAAIEALFAGEVDITYIGPNPAITGFIQSDGEALRIIAGATSGGALLVVRPEAGIKTAADLAGKKIATPQLGNTQDVALRAYLLDNGLAPEENGGDVKVIPTKNADTLTLFQQGEIDAAWVPEPWGTRLIQEAGGQLFLDEKDLWDGGQFVTAHVIVRTDFLNERPDIVKAFLQAHVDATRWINANAEEAKTTVNKGIEEASGAALAQETIDAAWKNIIVTYDPIASSLVKSADAAYKLGFLEDEPKLDGIYALDLLNEVLQEKGLDAVTG